MEEEIEKALDVTFNYNFAMDLEGNRHIERPDFSTKKSTSENSDDFAPRLYGETGGDQNRNEAEASWQENNEKTEKWLYLINHLMLNQWNPDMYCMYWEKKEVK